MNGYKKYIGKDKEELIKESDLYKADVIVGDIDSYLIGKYLADMAAGGLILMLGYMIFSMIIGVILESCLPMSFR